MLKWQFHIRYLENIPQYHKQLSFKERILLLCLIVINMHHVTIFTPGTNLKPEPQWKVSRESALTSCVHRRSLPPNQLVVYAWMTEKNMTFSHNRPIFRYDTEPSNYNHKTALSSKKHCTTREYRRKQE